MSQKGASAIAVVWRKARRAAELGVAEWLMLLRAYGWILAIHLGLRFAGYARVRRWLERGLPAEGTEKQVAPERLDQVAGTVDIAARNNPADVRCLTRSLALYRLVRSTGAPARLQLGVRRTAEGKLEAHAWVEVAGRILGDRAEVISQFAPLERWPPEVDRWGR